MGWMLDGQLWLAALCPERHPIGIQETTPYSTQGHCGDRSVVNGNTCVSTVGTRVQIYIYFTYIYIFSHKHARTVIYC